MIIDKMQRYNPQSILKSNFCFRHVVSIYVIAVAASFGCLKPAMAQTVYVDVNDYLVQASGTGAICVDGNVQCIHAYPNQFGELTIYYAENRRPVVVDYVARSYGSSGPNGAYYIGVSRSFSYDSQSDTSILRCFSDPGQFCTAPPNTSMMPEAVPRTLALNVIYPSEDYDASDPSTHTPIRPLNGTYSITGFRDFQVVSMDFSTCQQQLVGTVGAEVRAAYIYQFPFDGDIGTQNALIIEEIEYSSYPTIGHIERYYYVNGYGRVRDSIGFYNPDNQQWTPGSNPVRHWYYPDINQITPPLPPEPPNSCPQGTKPFEEGP